MRIARDASTMAVGSLLIFAIIGLFIQYDCMSKSLADEGAAVAPSTQSSQPVEVTTYLRDATVVKGRNTIVVAEISNATTQPIALDGTVRYKQEEITPSNATIAPTKERVAEANASLWSICVVVKVEKREKEAFWGLPGHHASVIATISPQNSEFIKLAIPAEVLNVGRCEVSVRVLKGDRVVAASESKPITCEKGD